MTAAGTPVDPAGLTSEADSAEPKHAVRWIESSYIFSLINENKLVSLLIYGAFVLLKVLAVSHWNVATASAILASSSAAGLILGAMLSALPMALLSVYCFVIFFWLSGHWDRRYSPRTSGGDGNLRAWAASRRPLLLSLLVLLPAMVLLPPATPVVACTAAAVVLGLVARLFGRSHGGVSVPVKETVTGRDSLIINWHVLRRNRPTFGCAVALAALLTLIGYGQLVSSVWLPHERVACTGCEHPVVGYVLDDNGTDMSILLTGSRTIRILPADRVLDRQVCTIPYSWPLTRITSSPKTVAQALGLRDDVPSCFPQ